MQYQTQSLLNELRLPCADDRGFVGSCTRIAWERGRSGKEEQFDNSIYSNGSTLYKFADAPSHQFHTAMCLYDLSMTPELWLVSAAQSTNVIGMSATALCDSALNFSFGYLAEKLGGIDYGSEAARASLVGASEANRERAKAAYDVRVDIIGDVIDDVNRLEKKDFWLSWAATVGASKEEMKAAWAVGEDHPTMENYKLQRWANAAWAVKAFWESGARAGVAFVPQATGPVTKQYLKELCEKWGVPDEAVKDIYSAGWDEGFLKVRAELAEGKRRIVVTTYQTAAEGKNLTYPIPDGAEDMVRLYDNDRKERDFDFLYFDKPTNVLISSAKCDAEKLKGAYEQERLAERGEISMQERFTRIKRLLSGKEGETKEKIPNIPINKLRSLSNGTAALVNQGAGRISRTPNKSKKVTILLNGALARTMSANAFEGQPVGNEFDCICKRLSGWKAENEDRRTDSEPDDSGFKMAMTADMIRLCLDAFSYDRGGAKFNMDAEKAVRTWDAIRNWVLAHPTPSDLDFEENRAMSRFYVRVAPGSGALRYQEKDDFKRCKLLKPGEQAEKGWRAGEVSAGAARLGSLTRNSVVRSHMESHGYATEWDMDSPWRMTPILFQNIYKGALGEAAGEALFDWLSGQTGEDMALDRMETDPARFEIFDFELRPGSGIYVDMKHWKADVPKKGEEGVEKALWKLGENGVGGRMAVYINAIGSKGAGWVPATRGDGKVVTIPGIIDEETGDFLLENVNYLLNELKKAI